MGLGATVLVLVLSILGLLCLRLGVYDDSALLLGARLVGLGKIPFHDFFTHYGPWGFVAMSPVLHMIGNAGLALRLAQCASLAILVLLLYLAVGRTDRKGGNPPLALAALALSPAVAISAFEGFTLVAAALALYVSGRGTRAVVQGRILIAAAGLTLACAALTRPAFAAYASASVLLAALVDDPKAMIRNLGLFAVSAAVGLVIVWALCFPGISPREAIEATIFTPARLQQSGLRFLVPEFLAAPLLLAIVIGAAIAAAPILWIFAAPPPRGRRAAAAAIIVGGLVPILFRHWQPGRTGSAAIGVVQFLLAGAIVVRQRAALRESPALRAAAVFGLTAAAFGHYFWFRPDQQHLFPTLGLAAAGTAFVFGRFSPRERIAAILIFGIALVPIGPGRESGLPIASLGKGGLARILENSARAGARWKTVWPCGEVPSHAVAAVSLADRLAGRSSRFVAYGSSQAATAGDPIYLFLLSSRLPYTKWFIYEPGLQSSATIQAEMIRELESSASRTAVVWRAEQFLYDETPPDLAARSPFDAETDRRYPRSIARFGNYEVRASEDLLPGDDSVATPAK